MILTKIKKQYLIKNLQEIFILASTLEEWGDMTYREEARTTKEVAKKQLRVLKN